MLDTDMVVQRIKVRLQNEFMGLVGRPEIARRFITRARELCVRFALGPQHSFKARLDDNGAICDIEYYYSGASSHAEGPNVHAGAAAPESDAAKIPVDEVRGGATELSAGQDQEIAENRNVPQEQPGQTQVVESEPVGGAKTAETEESVKEQQSMHEKQLEGPSEAGAGNVGDLGTHREAQGVKEAVTIAPAPVAGHVDVGALGYLQERLNMKSAYHFGCSKGDTLRYLLSKDIDAYGLGDRVVAEDIATRVFSYTIGEELDEAMMPSLDVALAIGIVEELDDRGFQNLMQVMGKCRYIVIAPPKPEDGIDARVLEGKKHWIAKFKDCGYVYRQARALEMRKESTVHCTRENGMIFERRK